MKKKIINNYKKMEKKNDDMDVDVAQRESSNIKRYASAFSNILMRKVNKKIINNYNKIKKKKKKDDDMDVDVAQRESSSIKRYASAFSNILIR